MWLTEPRGAVYGERRRQLAGPTGCGLCGIESLAEAMRTPRPVAKLTRRSDPTKSCSALDALPPAQAFNRETHAVHAAAFFLPGQPPVAIREDVGRHNALDKLAGALCAAARLRRAA